ncbi:MAG: hypothetical protein Q8L81_13875 [Bacteroidota bacterium]|nr:hypothetical protein [Bacteroidota bacterium]
MRKTAFILLFLYYAVSNAQFLDSLHDIFNHKSSIDARLESRNSFIDNQIISVTGVRLGVAFQRKLRIGGGVSWLKSDFKKDFYSENELGKTDTITKFLKMAYLAYYVDFVFHKTKRWQLSVPIQAGTGFTWWKNDKRYLAREREKKYFFILYEPGITAQFKVFRWFGLGADVAYRFTLVNSKKIGEKLNSPTYSLKILVWFDQLYYELFPNSKFTKKKGPAVW